MCECIQWASVVLSSLTCPFRMKTSHPPCGSKGLSCWFSLPLCVPVGPLTAPTEKQLQCPCGCLLKWRQHRCQTFDSNRNGFAPVNEVFNKWYYVQHRKEVRCRLWRERLLNLPLKPLKCLLRQININLLWTRVVQTSGWRADFHLLIFCLVKS